jgi:hypothetical protein
MKNPTKKNNDTFWPDDLVLKERGALGWTPLSRLLTANWSRFGLGTEYFATLVWLLTWVRQDFTNVRFVQVAIAKQQGVHRTTVYRQMKRMVELGIVEFVAPDRISFEPLMKKLIAFEAERQRERAAKSLDESLKAAGLLEDKGGRPPKPDQPSTARFGVPGYDNLCEGDDSAWSWAAMLASEPAAEGTAAT